VVTGGQVDQSILAPGVRVNARAEVTDSTLFDGVDVGEGAIIRRAILDKNVRVPAGNEIGIDLDLDRKQFTVSADGVVVVGKNQQLD
jgi:glucose-1-phosphate adenylyltransferase